MIALFIRFLDINTQLQPFSEYFSVTNGPVRP